MKAFRDARGFEEAREALRRFASDSYADIDMGTALFAGWAASLNHLIWPDVAPEKNETSIPKVMKDSSSERGKRMCVRGRIIEIARDRSVPEPLWLGGMFNGRGDIIRFFAVGSSGELVERSRAKFCGVVAGRYSYPNAAGGTSHAVSMVGMFDLPENRRQ